MRTRTFGPTQQGFTLIEVMITAAIVAILVGVALPSYKSYAVRASREAAKTELVHLAGLQEKIYLNSSAYATSVTTAYNGRSDGGLGITAGKTQDALYALSITASTAAQTYTLTATPATGSRQVGDGNVTINSSGTRLWGTKPW